MTFPQLECLQEEKERTENILQKTNEALMTFTNELKRLKKTLLHAVGNATNQNESTIEDQNIENIIRRLVKYKEDNKKLKSILK
jgi:hypothetical protein